MTTRRKRALLGAGATLTLLTAGLAIASTTATGAPAPGASADCPLPFPEASLTPGLEVTGKTTAGTYKRGATIHSSPQTPESFTGTYLSTIEDATGDLFLFELEGSRITNPDGSVDAGIWQGISGSPVYAANGQLVGSVSYAFTQATGSKIAGVTPAARLYDLLGETDPAPAMRVVPSRAERAELAEAGVPAAQTQGALRRLSSPVVLAGTSGLTAQSTKMLQTLAKRAGRPVPQLAAGSTGNQANTVPIVAGGNVAVADSYGSVALYSVGTAAAVCDDIVIGYGHPNVWSPAGGTIHGASTAMIMADGPVSFKMANLAAPVGTLLHDRLSGITGRVQSTLPAAATVKVTTTGPKSSVTESVVPNAEAIAYVAGLQTYRDAAMSTDEAGPGAADVAWDITFQRANGTVQTFSRSQHYASASSIADEVPNGVAGDVAAIQDNGFEDVTITDVQVRQTLTRSYKGLALNRVEAWVGGKWTTIKDGGRITVKSGSNVKVRASLVKDGRRSTGVPATKTFTLATPKSAIGRGIVSISGNGSSFWDEEFLMLFGEEEFEDGPQITSLNALLKLLAAEAPQNSVSANLAGITKYGKEFARTGSWSTPSVVSGSSSIQIKFQTPPKKKKKKKVKKKR
ncbi:hypothetical protein NODU109028_09095 [Nocardioides dubius]|uniref:Peptidase S55 domain-containing protein n=1 Tax=Nocardioides dubius TaxID=317019 RepID=A0ABN1TW18_9ACTN